MPETSQSATPRSNTTSSQSGQKKSMRMSRDKMAQQLSYRSFYHFMLSYQLKLDEEEDVEEGMAILQALWDHENQE
ncbi:uncharacterized protein Z520_10630 [Fonsecaea multimorphosa CBS 102226]|uniref:Uncharacterized protein n=1 Tax=Fonsecaea multimorphosa CBS 102226 TaxID=1442371 RepID=A0A0D2JT97_9EURO|nr:uncharacterized protein Z520_10630 [Fonsecaea multimorphosa CBS 102226]KIX93724.1 hypothetical protein Z520_10630 [Fonsecaea multimorphosa CBS 102226]